MDTLPSTERCKFSDSSWSSGSCEANVKGLVKKDWIAILRGKLKQFRELQKWKSCKAAVREWSLAAGRWCLKQISRAREFLTYFGMGQSMYWLRFLMKVMAASRTGLSCVIIGGLIQYVPTHALLQRMVAFTTYAPTIAIIACDATLGKVTSNIWDIMQVAIFVMLETMAIFKFVKPPISNIQMLSCIGICSFVMTLPSGVSLMGKKIGLTQICMTFITARLESDLDIIWMPIKFVASIFVGASAAFLALVLPFPQLAIVEVRRLSKSAVSSTSNLLQTVTKSFFAPNASTSYSIALHSKVLTQAAVEVIAELDLRKRDLSWEIKSSQTVPHYDNLTKGLNTLHLHLAGMELALQSHYLLQSSKVLRDVLEQPLMKLVQCCTALLDSASKLRVCFSGKPVDHSELVKQGKETLLLFDEALYQARRQAFYSKKVREAPIRFGPLIISRSTENTVSLDEILKRPHCEARRDNEGLHDLLGTQVVADIISPIKRKFMSRVTTYFFLFNVRLYLEGAMSLLDANWKANKGPDDKAKGQEGAEASAKATASEDKEDLESGQIDKSTDRSTDSELKGGAPASDLPCICVECKHVISAPKNSTFLKLPNFPNSARVQTWLNSLQKLVNVVKLSDVGNAVGRFRLPNLSEIRTFPVRSRRKLSSLTYRVTQRLSRIRKLSRDDLFPEWKTIKVWVGADKIHICNNKVLLNFAKEWLPTSGQVCKALKISMAMTLATKFGWDTLPYDGHCSWAPVTVAIFLGNNQGGSFRLAMLRIQGTVLGSIFGFLIISSRFIRGFSLLIALLLWVTISDYVRYSKTQGYSGIVSSQTAATMILGDFPSDIKFYAVDRVTETFVGVMCFVFVETVVFPERAVILVKREFVSSLSKLRDSIRSVVSTYTGHKCQHCRSLALIEIRKMEKELKTSLTNQLMLQAEAVEEPDLWFVPFPGDVYARLIAVQGRMLNPLHFMAFSLQATVEENLDEHMQALLKPLQASLIDLEEQVVAAIDFVQGLFVVPRASLPLQKILKWLVPPCLASRRSKDKAMKKKAARLRRSNAALRLIGDRRRSVAGTPLHLKASQKHFERDFEMMQEEVVTASKDAGGIVVSNSVMLSLSSLSFCLHEIMKETVEMEKIVYELLQAERPWSILDRWDDDYISKLYKKDEIPDAAKTKSSPKAAEHKPARHTEHIKFAPTSSVDQNSNSAGVV